MPETAVEYHCRSRRHQDGNRIFRVLLAIGTGKVILPLASGKNEKVTASGDRRIGQKEGHFDRYHGTRFGFEIAVQLTGILMPAKAEPVFLQRSTLGFGRRVGHVAMVELDVPVEQSPHLGKSLVMIEQLEKGIVPSDKVEMIHPVGGAVAKALPLLLIDPIYDIDQAGDMILLEHIVDLEVAVLLEGIRLCFGKLMIEAT